MIASYQNLSYYNQFLFKKDLKLAKTQVYSDGKMRNSGNCIYDYAHSFFGEDLKSNTLYWSLLSFYLFIIICFDVVQGVPKDTGRFQSFVIKKLDNIRKFFFSYN